MNKIATPQQNISLDDQTLLTRRGWLKEAVQELTTACFAGAAVTVAANGIINGFPVPEAEKIPFDTGKQNLLKILSESEPEILNTYHKLANFTNQHGAKIASNPGNHKDLEAALNHLIKVMVTLPENNSFKTVNTEFKSAQSGTFYFRRLEGLAEALNLKISAENYRLAEKLE